MSEYLKVSFKAFNRLCAIERALKPFVEAHETFKITGAGSYTFVEEEDFRQAYTAYFELGEENERTS